MSHAPYAVLTGVLPIIYACDSGSPTVDEAADEAEGG